jgi:hypothetical protein
MWAKVMTLICLLLVGLAGCGWFSKRAATEQEVEESRIALTTALEAWKSGRLATLASQKPPIRFQDDDCVSGWQLMDYQFANPAEKIQRFANVKVQVELKDSQGKSVRKTVTYQVGLDPITVQRSDN